MTKRKASKTSSAGKAQKRGGSKEPEYEVGRGKPPAERKFKKGQTGNPKGRPKGSKNLATLIEDAAYNKITVTTKSGDRRKLTRIQATTLQLANRAAQGDPKSVLKFMEWVDEIEQRAAASRPADMPIGEADQKVLQTIYERLQLCKPPGEDS